jgi:hypothetical protein
MSTHTMPATLLVEHVTDHFDDGALSFTRDKVEMGTTFKAEVYTPDSGRQQHVQVTTWGHTSATKVAVDPFVGSDGAVCTTVRLTVDGRTVDLSMWGVTLDALAVAVEAAQRV